MVKVSFCKLSSFMMCGKLAQCSGIKLLKVWKLGTSNLLFVSLNCWKFAGGVLCLLAGLTLLNVLIAAGCLLSCIRNYYYCHYCRWMHNEFLGRHLHISKCLVIDGSMRTICEHLVFSVTKWFFGSMIGGLILLDWDLTASLKSIVLFHVLKLSVLTNNLETWLLGFSWPY